MDTNVCKTPKVPTTSPEKCHNQGRVRYVVVRSSFLLVFYCILDNFRTVHHLDNARIIYESNVSLSYTNSSMQYAEGRMDSEKSSNVIKDIENKIVIISSNSSVTRNDSMTVNVKHSDSASSMSSFVRTRERFEPGSLEQHRADVISQCFTGSRNHPYIKPVYFPPGCTRSPKYNVTLWYIEKTGTTTQRQVMKQTFKAIRNASNQPCRKFAKKGGLKVTVTRNPVDLFLSGIKEVFIRYGLFEPSIEPAHMPQHSRVSIPTRYLEFTKPIRNMTSEEKNNISIGATQADWLLREHMFASFLADYDGETVFDVHIQPAINKMFRADRNHATEHFDIVMNADNLTNAFESLAQRVGAPTPEIQKLRTSSNQPSKYWTMDGIGNKAIQKICQLVRTDACCLNYELPEMCRLDEIPKEERVMCEWVQTSNGERKIVGVVGSKIFNDSVSLTTEYVHPESIHNVRNR